MLRVLKARAVSKVAVDRGSVADCGGMLLGGTYKVELVTDMIAGVEWELWVI